MHHHQLLKTPKLALYFGRYHGIQNELNIYVYLIYGEQREGRNIQATRATPARILLEIRRAGVSSGTNKP